MAQKKQEVKIPPNRWVQIGGDQDYTDSLILGKFEPEFEEIQIIEITRDGKEYHGNEKTFELAKLKRHDLEEFGINPEMHLDSGLELIAQELLLQNGGDPINCDGQADYRSDFPNFDTALACAIGLGVEFETWGGKKISPRKEKVRK